MTERKLVPCADCGKPEEWRPIAGYETSYMISSHGRVKSLPRVVMRSNGRVFTVQERILRPGFWQSGHLFVILQKNGQPDKRGVHRLVLEAYEGPCPPRMQCRHADDYPTHNHRANLSWGTRVQNRADAILNARHKYAPDQIRAIRTSLLNQYQLAALYGCSQGEISRIKGRKGYKAVGD
jgi:NUMOD4 motif/HNH endonuclease